MTFAEYSVAGPAANIAITNGNNQSAPAGTQLPQALTVLVNRPSTPIPFPGPASCFPTAGAGGTFSNSNPVVTGANGTAAQSYTLPAIAGLVTINAPSPEYPTPPSSPKPAISFQKGARGRIVWRGRPRPRTVRSICV